MSEKVIKVHLMNGDVIEIAEGQYGTIQANYELDGQTTIQRHFMDGEKVYIDNLYTMPSHRILYIDWGNNK